MNDVLISFFSASFDKAAQGLAGGCLRLAEQLGGSLRALVMTPGAEQLTSALTRIADAVTVAQQPALATYQPETYLAALSHVCAQVEPSAVLLGNDTYSQELAPRLAYRLGGSAVGDAVAVRSADDKVFVARQVYGGKAQAVIELKRKPAVVWLRARSFAPAAMRQAEASISHATFDVQLDSRTRLTEQSREQQSEVKLEE